jgi:hypothetical protein
VIPYLKYVIACSEKELNKARFSNGAFASKGLMYWMEDAPDDIDLVLHIYSGIKKP